MFEDIAIWILVVGVLVGLGAAYATPSTRPYAKKYWWLAVVLAAVGASYVLLRRRPGSVTDAQIDEGQEIAKTNTAAFDAIVDHAQEQAAWADAELTRKRIESKITRAKYDTEVETIAKIEDSVARRKALIQIVEAHS